jgi:hypothetical protein
MFFTESAARLSARDSFAEAASEAQWNWDQDGQSSTIRQSPSGRLVALFDGGSLRPLVRGLAA